MDTRYGILRFGPAVNQRLHPNLRPLSQKGSISDASRNKNPSKSVVWGGVGLYSDSIPVTRSSVSQ